MQVNAVRLLVAEHQIAGVRSAVHSSQEPVAIVDGGGRLLFANPAFAALLGRPLPSLGGIDDLAGAFIQPELFAQALAAVRGAHQSWRGELALRPRDGEAPLPVGLRAECVPGRDGQVLGCIVVLTDLRGSRRVDAARQHLEQSLQRAGLGRREDGAGSQADGVIGAILTHASLAAMDIADGAGGPGVAPLLEEVEASARRATALYGRLRQLFGA